MKMTLEHGDLGLSFGPLHSIPDLELYYSDRYKEYVVADANWKSINVETQMVTSIPKEFQSLTFRELIDQAELRVVTNKMITDGELIELFDLFETPKLLYKTAYIRINNKIANNPKFDNVAFLSSVLTKFYFKFGERTVISLEYNDSAMIDLYDPNRISSITSPNNTECRDRHIWMSAFTFLGGLIKDHTVEEIKILLSEDCQYITLEEAKNILKIS